MAFEAGVGAAAGASTLWQYNRSNFMFDREMRFKQELQTLEFRKVQAELWREDIKDLVGLTERKMDSYLIVSVLMTSMCIAFFTEGRLEPGTPPWLLHFYVLSLGGAFMYMLMAVWFCMHASVVAACAEVRMLTQFVRLPIPTWQQMHDMRTFGEQYEEINALDMLRIPFTGSLANIGRSAAIIGSGDAKTHSSSGGAKPPVADTVGADGSTCDPWRLEPVGVDRGIYELQEQPVGMRRHVQLARRAAAQYQCYDAFARVAMTFGINQMTHAIAYYTVGYVCIQDGAGLPAYTIIAMMCAVAAVFVQLDFSLTRPEQVVGLTLNFATFGSSASCAAMYVNLGTSQRKIYMEVALPVTFALHSLWLTWCLCVMRIRRQPNGAELPERFRAVLYLDVFGWLRDPNDMGDTDLRRLSASHLGATSSSISRGDGALQPLPSGEHQDVPDDVFHPSSYAAPHGAEHPTEVVTGYESINPVQAPANVFRYATRLLILLWALASLGGIVYDGQLPGFLAVLYPFVYEGNTVKPEADIRIGPYGDGTTDEVNVQLSEDHNGNFQLAPEPPGHGLAGPLPALQGGEHVSIVWPNHAAFVPSSFHCDPSGQLFIAADEFAIYTGELRKETGGQAAESDIAAALAFKEVPLCKSLEGHALQDVSVGCSGPGQACSVFALSSRGHHLTECPVAWPGAAIVAAPATALRGVAKGHLNNWNVSSNWLHGVSQAGSELVKSFAADGKCLSTPTTGRGGSGCVVVGTSQGRLVELQRSHGDGRRLVPRRILHQREHPEARSSLSLLPGGVLLALWPGTSSMSAFDVYRGVSIGEWQLPEGTQWLNAAVSIDAMYILGLDGKRNQIIIARFGIPSVLSGRLAGGGGLPQ